MDIVTPHIQVLQDDAIYGKFVIEPLEQGFGYTIGNAMRRVLMSSIPGAAITSIKIDGVLHEFSTIPGVKEDTTEIILNLREMFVKTADYHAEPQIVTIDVRGPGEVTGADVQVPSGIEIANPEVHLANLDDQTTVLRAEMTVEWGKGYVMPGRHDRVKESIGVIPVGAVFTPVQRVSYTVDPTRVGHKTDYDRLVLEVWTNGTIKPSSAVQEAATILASQLQLFLELAGGSRDIGLNFGGKISQAQGPPDTKIEELDFSVRTYNCLKKANVLTIRELAALSMLDLTNIRNFGRKSLSEVKEKLASMGLELQPSNERGDSMIVSEAYGAVATGVDEDEDAIEVLAEETLEPVGELSE